MKPDNEAFRKIALGFAGVTEVFVYSGAGFFLGRLLDHKLSTEPWLTVALTLVGLAGGFIRLVKLMQQPDR
jgi:F0F1-type ATP synthase assembly protein I